MERGATPLFLLLYGVWSTLHASLFHLPSLPRGLTAPTGSLGPWDGLWDILAANAIPGRDDGVCAGFGGGGHHVKQVVFMEGTSAPGRNTVLQYYPHRAQGYHSVEQEEEAEMQRLGKSLSLCFDVVGGRVLRNVAPEAGLVAEKASWLTGPFAEASLRFGPSL